MSTEDDILIDSNGNAVDIEATTSLSFFANILKRVWPTKEVKYELKYKTRKVSDGAKSDSSASSSLGIWSKLTALLAQEHSSGSTRGSTPRDSVTASVASNSSHYENPPLEIKSGSPPRVDRQPVQNCSGSGRTQKSFSEEYSRVKTRRESIFGNIKKRNSRNLNELYHQNNVLQEQNQNNVIPNGNNRVENQNWQNGGGDANRITFQAIVTSPTSDDLRIENRNEAIRGSNRGNFYNVNEMDMGALYRSGMQSDVVITCRGEEFKAHSFVLKAQSGHFRRILFMKADTKPIVINQLQPEDMEVLLQYMYTGRIGRNYCSRDGELSRRFELMLQDYDVPYPDGTQPLYK